MKPVEPLGGKNIARWRRVEFAKNQDGYNTLVALVDPHGRVRTRWEPTEDERYALLDGACITLEILTFNQPLQPLLMYVEGSEGLIELPEQESV